MGRSLGADLRVFKESISGENGEHRQEMTAAVTNPTDAASPEPVETRQAA